MVQQQGRPWPAIVWVLLGALTGAVGVGLATFLYVHFMVPEMPAPKPPVETAVMPIPTELPPLPEYHDPLVEAPTVTPTQVVTPTEVSTTEPQTLYPQGAGKLALVIDDVGMDGPHSTQLLEITPPEVTLAFLVEGQATPELAAKAAAAGHSIILHLPMEPQGENTPPLGPYGLQMGMDSPTLVAQVAKNLAQLPNVEGVNNHMGSRFTQWEAGMQVVLAELANRGLYFLDSRTAAPTATQAASEGLNIGLAQRDVFLDHEPNEAAVRTQLQRAVKLAQARMAKGDTRPVVVIGHPLPATLAVLQADLPLLRDAGLTLVPLRAAVR
jgi:polysaccharide deacetylase 2 family uncharacterized protein YibQ